MNVAVKVLSRVLGMVVFITVLFLSEYLLDAAGVTDPFVLSFIGFLKDSLMPIIVFSIILLAGEVFTALAFPLNLPAPLLNAAGIFLVFDFIYGIFSFIDSFSSVDILESIGPVKPLFLIVIFFGVLIAGYIDIFSRAFGGRLGKRSRKERMERDLTLGEIEEEFEDVVRHPKDFVRGFAEELHVQPREEGKDRG